MYLHYRWLLLQVKVMKSYSMDQSIQVQTLIQPLCYHDCPARERFWSIYFILKNIQSQIFTEFEEKSFVNYNITKDGVR